MPGPGFNVFLGAFGVTAAVLLVGGFLVLRFQRNRFRFLLMQAGMEKGVHPLAGLPPLWLISLRQGTMAIAVGIVLVLIGIAVGSAAAKVPIPTEQQARTVILPTQLAPPAPDPFAPDRPDATRMGPGDAPLPGPPGPPGHGPRADRFGPPPRDLPQVELWHRAQDRKTLAGISASAGVVLAVLGLVRVLFAFAERRYSASDAPLM